MYKDMVSINNDNTRLMAINNSIRNIILTPRGSVPGKPRFGSDIYKIVFSQLDSLTETMAKNYINEALSEFEDRINVLSINIQQVPEYNRMVINISYQYKDDFSISSANTSIAVSL